MLTGNKGECSEIYVLLRLLADRKIYAADSELNKLEDVYFPIIKIIREENKGEIKEYAAGEIISIYINGSKVKELLATEFEAESKQLLNEISSKASKGAFSVESTQNFMNKILCYKLSAPATDKSDITIKIIDTNTGYSPTVGFSIKSKLGSSPTLLNAGKTKPQTLFIKSSTVIQTWFEKPMKYISYRRVKITRMSEDESIKSLTKTGN